MSMEQLLSENLIWQDEDYAKMMGLYPDPEPWPNPSFDSATQNVQSFAELSDYQTLPQRLSEVPKSPSTEKSESSVEDQLSEGGSRSAVKKEDDVDRVPRPRRRPRPKGPRYGVKVRSEKESMEDGYKWKKYGRKKVKSSSCLRNYYKCSEMNCDVKKRIERDSTDPSMIVVTYEGQHNHVSPATMMCLQPLLLPQQKPGSKPVVVFVHTGYSSQFPSATPFAL